LPEESCSSAPSRWDRGTRLTIDDQILSGGGCRRLWKCLPKPWEWLTVLLFVASGAFAQSGRAAPQAPDAGISSTGILQGVVTGKDGEVYEGVRVAMTLTGNQPPRVQMTNGEGEFTFVNVPAGAFTLTVSSDGFVTQTVSGVLPPGETYEAPAIVLPLAQATSEVRVSAEQQEEIAQEQIHIEEKQHVLGVVPNFYVSYAKNSVPLTTRQKYSLAWRSNIDPFTWLLTGATAGVEQADNTFAGYGQGMQGYAKRFGANYADTFISTEIGDAILPSLFKQDPRYFYMGTGSVRSRSVHAIASAVICKGDNMRWQFNYSGILGGLAAGGISNLYYPSSDRGNAAVTFENAGVQLALAAVQNLFQEFLVKKLTPSARRAAAP
jgi:hypothetical protein